MGMGYVCAKRERNFWLMAGKLFWQITWLDCLHLCLLLAWKY